MRRLTLHQREREERGKTDKERDGDEKNLRLFSLIPSLSRVLQTPTGNQVKHTSKSHNY